jgi:hypothetical protein
VGLETLSAAELALFDGLKAGKWGARLRLEQERIPSPAAMAALQAACSALLLGSESARRAGLVGRISNDSRRGLALLRSR